MHRIFVAPHNVNIVDRLVVIDDEQARHIERVLRLKSGDSLTAFDGTGAEYNLRLQGRIDGTLVGEIEDIRAANREPQLRLALIQGIAKGDKMDTIIQKAVEIGISAIYPVVTQYSVVRLDKEKAEKKVNRWQTIAREACKQCRRNLIPEIKPVMDLQACYSHIKDAPVIMLYENETEIRLRTVLEQNADKLKNNTVFLLVGPEGGFSPEEVAEVQSRGGATAGLGPRILRTETAGLAAASIIMYELGDLG
ncbi:MAG: 16S rRNA (uracil(1498)-N(3))-methyltransferase [Syntrophomonas sp.]